MCEWESVREKERERESLAFDERREIFLVPIPYLMQYPCHSLSVGRSVSRVASRRRQMSDALFRRECLSVDHSHSRSLLVTYIHARTQTQERERE